MADGAHGAVFVHDMPDGGENVGILAELLGRGSAGQDEAVVLIGIDLLGQERRVDGIPVFCMDGALFEGCDIHVASGLLHAQVGVDDLAVIAFVVGD